jgi:hypothetical protein
MEVVCHDTKPTYPISTRVTHNSSKRGKIIFLKEGVDSKLFHQYVSEPGHNVNQDPIIKTTFHLEDRIEKNLIKNKQLGKIFSRD